MSSSMYVCFECKKSRRYTGWQQERPKCQFCKAFMIYAFYKFEMPKSDDLKGWRAYKEKVIAFNGDIAAANITRYKKDIARFTGMLEKVNANNHKRIHEIETLINDRIHSMKFWHNYNSTRVG